MSVFKWFADRRKKRNSEIASEVVRQLEAQQGWEKFLPPVAIRDNLYMVTENGSIYRMGIDVITGMEKIIKIQTR